MTKKIAFFSVGFAFNRLVRLRYYEKIFPPDFDIFLITTNKYKDHEKWTGLKRTKIKILNYRLLRNSFEIRKFCKKNKIDVVSNLGHPFGAIPLIFSSIFENRENYLYFLGDSIDYPKIDTLTKSGIRYLLSLIPYFFIEKLSKKSAFVGYNSFRKAPIMFLSSPEKFHYLHAPVNTDIFKPFPKEKARKKLGLKNNKKVILYVGRITKRKGGDLLLKTISSNPQIKFILIGSWKKNEIGNIKLKNMIVIDSVPNDKLPFYYSVADLVFAYHRQGCQMGIVGAESLACGVPVLHTKRIAFKDSPAIIKVSDSSKEVNKKIEEFFQTPVKKRIGLSKMSRDYALNNLSDEHWKARYLDFFLN